MDRSMISELNVGKEALLKGWIFEIRDLAKLKFFILRDASGMIQCVIKDKKLFEIFSDLSLESVVEVSGTVNAASVKADGVRPDIEVGISKIKLISKAENLPILVNEKTISTELSNRLDFRALDIRKPKVAAVFKIQSVLASAFREFFFNKGFLEIQTPCVIAAASEGGTDLFEVNYFDKKAYLAQSPQLYKQMIACSLEKVFTITPVWRAEKHNTTRHINEIRQMDVEVAFADQFVAMKFLEEVVACMVQKVIDSCKPELEILGIKPKIPKGVYLHYNDAIKESGGTPGEDFTPEQERSLCEKYKGDIVFTHSWPASIKPFYIMPKDENAKSAESCGFDALYLGTEISSGGQRIHLPNVLIEMIKSKNLNPDNFKDYIDSFRFGSPPHAGWSIGLERLTQVICGLSNVKEATLFPRDRDRLTP